MHTLIRSKQASHQLAMAFDLALALLLLLLFLGPCPVVRASALGDDDDYRIVAVSSMEPKAGAACLGHRVIPPTNLTWVPVDLRRGPCSASLEHAAAVRPSVEDLLHRDELRAADVQKRLSSNGTGDNKAPSGGNAENVDVYSHAQIVTQLGSQSSPPPPSSIMASSDPLAAAAAVGGVGSSSSLLPGVIQTVVLDTASDVPWVQCVPCPVPPCHPQKDSFYDPTMSPTYAAFSCGSPACRQLGPYANGCASNQCQYRVAYPDGSSTSGTYSSDLLTLSPTASISNFQFGCSHADSGSFDPQAAGIMALGGGPESLISQTASRYGKTFSYCLPPSPIYLGFFILGAPAPAPVASPRYVVTPMLRDRRAPATYYRVLLRAITVGGQRIAVPAAVFAAGAVLDSRTLITRLPPTAYGALRAAFRSSMRAYRAAPPKGSLDTCYDFTGVRRGGVRLPRVVLVFDGNAAVELDPSGILFNSCLAFAANRDDRTPVILGSVQQQTIEVLYDVPGGAVGFRSRAC